MFKILVLQALYSLSDEATEFQIKDQLSFQRFLGVGLDRTVPDAATVWLLRERLVTAKAIDKLFARFDAALKSRSYLAMGWTDHRRYSRTMSCTHKPDSHDRRVIQFSRDEIEMARFNLTDFEWLVIEPLLPTKVRGVKRVDDRRVLNGIFWRLRTRAPWADIPARYGPHMTCVNRFKR
jgi:hypothetical protein